MDNKWAEAERERLTGKPQDHSATANRPSSGTPLPDVPEMVSPTARDTKRGLTSTIVHLVVSFMLGLGYDLLFVVSLGRYLGWIPIFLGIIALVVGFLKALGEMYREVWSLGWPYQRTSESEAYLAIGGLLFIGGVIWVISGFVVSTTILKPLAKEGYLLGDPISRRLSGMASARLGYWVPTAASPGTVSRRKHTCRGPKDDATFFFNQAAKHSLDRDIDECIGDLTKAIELDPLHRMRAQRDDALEWARTHTHVRKLLGLD